MRRLVVITGASKGLGKGLTNTLLSRDQYDLVTMSRSDIEQSDHPSVKHFKVDLIQPGDYRWLRDICEDYSKVTFINNAGVISPIGFIGGFSVEEIERNIYTNQIAPFSIINALVKNNFKYELSIINITSGAANKLIKGWSLYSVTKAAVLNFLEHLKDQHSRIKIFSFDPGVLDTEMQLLIRSSSDKNFPDVANFQAMKNEGFLKDPIVQAEEIVNRFLD